MSSSPRAVLLALAMGCAACEDLSDFSTGPGEAYCGSITIGGSFRTGFSTRVQMRLELDASLLDDPAASPGTLATFEAADEVTPERRIVDDAALRPIPPLHHDALSHAELGDGRERTAIFAVSPAVADAEGMLAVISLRSDDRVEVRLVRPGAVAEEGQALPEGRRMLFGLFVLDRKGNRCGF
jgi:hypothetical protein